MHYGGGRGKRERGENVSHQVMNDKSRWRTARPTGDEYFQEAGSKWLSEGYDGG